MGVLERVQMRACVREVCVRARASVRARVRACVRACVFVFAISPTRILYMLCSRFNLFHDGPMGSFHRFTR